MSFRRWLAGWISRFGGTLVRFADKLRNKPRFAKYGARTPAGTSPERLADRRT